MFAVIESLGRQYKVSVGDLIKVDRISSEGDEVAAGSKIIFTNVLMLGGSEAEAKVGKPYIAGCSVTGELVEYGKDKKVIAFKKKRRKGFKKKIGFRRKFTSVLIKEIKAA